MPANGPMRQLSASEISRCFIKAKENMQSPGVAMMTNANPMPSNVPPWVIEFAAECSRQCILEFCKVNHLPHDFPPS